MFKALFIASTAAALLANPSPSSAQDPGPLEPSSTWDLDYGENRCRLARQFGEGSEKHAFIMEMDKPAPSVRLVVTGPSLSHLDTSRPIDLIFGDLNKIEVREYSFGEMEPFGPAIILGSVSLDAPEEGDEHNDLRRAARKNTESPLGIPGLPIARFADVTSFAIEQEKSEPVAFQLAGFAGALKELGDCADKMIAFWGLDLEQHRTMRRRPVLLNSRRVVSTILSNYTRGGSRNDDQGIVRMLVIVGADGKVEECRQSNVTAMESDESPVCRVMRRARFRPALDKDGNPMRSYYASSVRYVLPN